MVHRSQENLFTTIFHLPVPVSTPSTYMKLLHFEQLNSGVAVFVVGEVDFNINLMDLNLFGKTAAVASVLTATNPVEIIKLRLQTAHELFATGRIKENYSSITQCVTSMVEKEGVKSFWKGNTVGILRFFPN